MSKTRAEELIALGDRLYTDKAPLNGLCQEIAENVYPFRADFTTERYLGENYADHLMDSFPSLARQELGDSMSAINRPKGKAWFAASTRDDTLDNDPSVARFLEYLTDTTRNRLYDPRVRMVGVTKMADHDYVSFGQAPMSMEEAPSRQHPFMRMHHFRDMAWLENEVDVIDHAHRKDRMTARVMKKKFGEKKLHDTVKNALEKSPGQNFNIRCIVMPSDEYDLVGEGAKNAKGGKHPFCVIYIDADNMHILKEGGMALFPYIIPRWHRIPGYQYAFSPAAMTSLPDARMAQMLARIILEAGEKQVDPPILALEERVREASLQSGSITWVDAEYDKSVGDAVQALKLNSDMTTGFEMRKDVREMLTRAWCLNKLTLPEAGKTMTAYETAQRIEEHVRNLLPLFEPREIEFEGALLDKTFYVLDNMKAYDWSLMPDALSGKEIFWTFKNPMQEASERILVSQFGEVMQLVKAAQEFGLQASPVKIDVAIKDAIRGTSAPATWRKTQEEQDQEAAEAQKRQRLAGMAQELATAGDVAGKLGDGAQKLQEAGVLPSPKRDENGNPVSLPPATLAPRQQAPALSTLYPQQLNQQAA